RWRLRLSGQTRSGDHLSPECDGKICARGRLLHSDDKDIPMNRLLIAFSTAALLAATLPFPQAYAECDEQQQKEQGCVELRTVVHDDLELGDPWTRVMQPG